MKRIVLFICIIFSIFLITGCGKEEVIDDNSNLGLYSDNTKVVFKYDNNTYVYYYSDNKITGYHNYIDYGDEETAQAAYQLYKGDKDNGKLENVDELYLKGQYLVIEFNKSEYEKYSLSDIRTNNSYMEEIKK